MKKFVKQPGGADIYENLSVKYISGHNPDLVIYDDNIQVERIDLKKKDVATIKEMLREKGIYERSNACMDTHPDCKYWADHGQCTENSVFMHANCKSSCNQCKKEL